MKVVALSDTHAPRRWRTCPLDESGDGLRIFNPGSPTDRRRRPHGTVGLLTVEDGVLARAEIVPVT